MNNFTMFRELPSLNALLRKQERHLEGRLYNLKIEDVATEDKFRETLDFLKATILLQPVSVNMAGFGRLKDDARWSSVQQVAGKLKGIVRREVNFSFTGSRELF